MIMFICGLVLLAIGGLAEIDGFRRMNRATESNYRATETFNRAAEVFNRAAEMHRRTIEMRRP